MKKENLYILAGTLAITSIVGFTTFASSSLPTKITTNTPNISVQDTDKETKDDWASEVNDKQEISSNNEAKTDKADEKDWKNESANDSDAKNED